MNGYSVCWELFFLFMLHGPLKFFSAKPLIVLFSGSVNVSKGANIILPCRAVGNPPLTYSWHRSALQTPLSLSPRIRIDGKRFWKSVFFFSIKLFSSECVFMNLECFALWRAFCPADNETLHISNAHQSDAGEYYCIAENNIGQDRRKTTITVFSGK